LNVVVQGFSLLLRAECWHNSHPGSNPRQGWPLYIWMFYTPSAMSILGMDMRSMLKYLFCFQLLIIAVKIKPATMLTQVGTIGQTSVTMSWTPPSNSNGPSVNYELLTRLIGGHSLPPNASFPIVQWEGTATQAYINTLAPYHR
jgi:hypothetical protein